MPSGTSAARRPFVAWSWKGVTMTTTTRSATPEMHPIVLFSAWPTCSPGVCWIAAWPIARDDQRVLQTGLTVFEAIAMMGQVGFAAHGLFGLGAFGPLLGYVTLRRYRPILGECWGWPLQSPSLFVRPPCADFHSWRGFRACRRRSLRGGGALATIAWYLLANFLASGTEELGRRGTLYPALRERGHSIACHG